MWDFALASGLTLGAVCTAVLVRSRKSVNDPLSNDAHGDCFPIVTTDAQLLTRLYASEGTGCEVGFHSSLIPNERQRNHG